MSAIRGHHQLLMRRPSTPPSGFYDLVMAQTPVFYLRMGDNAANGLVTDATGNMGFGLRAGTSGSGEGVGINTSTVASASLLSTDSNGSFTFANGPFVIGNSNGPTYASDPFSVGAIVTPQLPASGAASVILNHSSRSGGFSVDVMDVGLGDFRIVVVRAGVGILLTSSSRWAYGTKLFIVAVYSDPGIVLYVNGASQGSDGTASWPGPYTSDTRVRIGSEASNGSANDYRYRGGIDEVFMTLNQITLSEAAAMYAYV